MRHPGEVRIARGCWLPAASADDLTARCIAALDTCADNTVVSSTTAARLHGFWLPTLADEIHLATAEPDRASRWMTRTQRPEFRAHRRLLTDRDRATVEGIPATSAARTWVDLAPLLTLPDLVAAGDSALRLGCPIDELSDTVGRSARLRGVRRARQALPLLDGRSRSRPESHLRMAVTAPDLPAFAVNEPIYRSDGGWLAEPDLSLRDARLALEYQGQEHADGRRMRADITRSADLRSEGWLTLYYGPAQVFGRPWQITPEMRCLIRERAPQLLRRRAAMPRSTSSTRRRVVSSASSG